MMEGYVMLQGLQGPITALQPSVLSLLPTKELYNQVQVICIGMIRLLLLKHKIKMSKRENYTGKQTK
jgi:hypothetical protein